MKYTRTFLLLILPVLIIASYVPSSAQDSLTLKAIYADQSLDAKSVPGFNFRADGRHYTRLIDGKIVEFDIVTGDSTDLLFNSAEFEGINGFSGQIDGYAFNGEENKLLLTTMEQQIYRRSSSAFYYVFDLETRKLNALYAKGRQKEATFSPNGEMVAFVHENNLYYKELLSGDVIQVTDDGEINAIINGHTDWVYEEEFAFTKAFAWSPNSQHIAFIRFDEREVPLFSTRFHLGRLYPHDYQYKYPKAGSTNSKVTVKIYHVDKEKSVDVSLPPGDIYIPRIKWTVDPDRVLIWVLNRHQNHLYLLIAKAESGSTTILYQEKNEYYIDIHDNLTFVRGGEGYIWTSDKDGYNHIYHMSMGGDEIGRVTEGEYEVTDFYGYDESCDCVYYQAARESSLQREIYRTSLNDGTTERISLERGTHEAEFSSTFDFYIDTYTTLNDPPLYTVRDSSGRLVRTLEDNMDLRNKQVALQVEDVRFHKIKGEDGTDLNAYMLRPPGFDPNREYPLLMFVYGGPGSQRVADTWQSHYYWFFQYLAKQGYLVAAVDNRGTGGRGAEFKKMTYLQLGHYETLDQIAAAKYFASLPFIDEDRIGIFGWSYGGYLSTLSLLKGHDIFNLGVAVAPVTHWAWYDTIYTERYMRTPQENPEGYRDNSPVYFADRLKGKYLIVHGQSDDNVHFQHTAEMIDALVRAGKPFEMAVYPNNAHGIGQPGAKIHLFNKITDFIKNNL